MSISVTGVQTGIEGIVGNPTLTISDMIGEIVEVDSAADGMSDTEYNDEEEKEMIHELEEEKAPLKSSPASVSKVAPPAQTKELSPEEKFELELAQCPKDEQEYIRKAREGIKRFVEIANDPNWKQIDKKKDNIVFSMDGDGGLK